MIHKQTTDKNLWGDSGEYEVIHYYGEDVPERFKKYMNHEVKTKLGNGIILGLEENEAMLDLYFMIYYPELDIWGYELCIDAEFYKENDLNNI